MMFCTKSRRVKNASRAAGCAGTERSGFTLIELLIVVVIIGILAAIGIPTYASTKEKAFVTTMKSDLHNLVTAEEGFLADSGTYYGGAVPSASFPYRPSSGATVTIASATVGGWQATAAYPTGTAKTCAVFYGNVSPLAPARVSGEPVCQ
jgi:type IV pilus assembly protein PilA